MHLNQQASLPKGFEVVGVRRYVRERFPKTHAALVALRSHVQSGITTNLAIVQKLDSFYPNSSQYWRYPELTYSCANNLARQLGTIQSQFKGDGGGPFVLTAGEFATANEGWQLGNLLSAYGSDKAQLHAYHLVYWYVLEQLGRYNPLRLLEVGLGTNNPVLISTMGSAGSPGASLKAFRDYLPLANIYGVDVDIDILFEDDRISTTWTDQLDSDSLAAIGSRLGTDTFDLIVDDGLHTVEANLNTLLFAVKSLSDAGWFIVEDIPERSLPVWQVVQRIFHETGWASALVQGNVAFMFLLTRQQGGRSGLSKFAV